MTANNSESVPIIIRGFPRKIRNKWKAFCAVRGISMSEGYLKAIRAYMRAKTCEWCNGSGIRTHPDDTNPDGVCSMCEGSGIESTKLP